MFTNIGGYLVYLMQKLSLCRVHFFHLCLCLVSFPEMHLTLVTGARLELGQLRIPVHDPEANTAKYVAVCPLTPLCGHLAHYTTLEWA